MRARSLFLGLTIACSLGLSGEAQTSTPPNYPNVKMFPNGEWDSIQPEMDGDGDALNLVLGVDLARYAANARTDNLNGGSTEAYAERMQRFANANALTYAYAHLRQQAGMLAQHSFQIDPDLLQLTVKLIVRTGRGDDLQEHLIESFSCTRTDIRSARQTPWISSRTSRKRIGSSRNSAQKPNFREGAARVSFT